MDSLVDLEKLFHRSRDRINELGEVFTQESYVDDMLTLLAKGKKGFWSNVDIIFFEPCCGHGNIVLQIYKRRLEGFYRAAILQSVSEPAYYAVANSLNSLWAIDIDANNIETSRTRVLAATFEFLKAKQPTKNEHSLLTKKVEFFAHVIAAIRWHIDENETLSSLSDLHLAKENASKTKAGTKWFSVNGHHKIDFDCTWIKFFSDCKKAETVPLDFERSIRVVTSLLNGENKIPAGFEFVKVAIQLNKAAQGISRPKRSLSVGL